MEAPDTLKPLMNSPLFKGLNPLELRTVTAHSQLRLYGEGERIPIGDEIWIVHEGLVRENGAGTAGTSSWLSAPGQAFGCLDLRCGRKHLDEAFAMLPTETISIPRTAFDRLFMERPLAVVGLVHALAERLREERETRALMGLPASEKMLGTILSLYRRLGKRIPMTRAEIADFAGLARETAIRTLSPFEKSGLIRTRRGKIEIVKPAELQKTFDRCLASR